MINYNNNILMITTIIRVQKILIKRHYKHETNCDYGNW